MKIISGQYKGRTVQTFRNAPYRPTSSRVRKSLFEILGTFDELNVLDLFAGSGILGFEALSRRAASVTFVESDSKVVQMLKNNALNFQSQKLKIIRKDVFKFLKNCPSYDLIFADPPYDTEGLQSLVDLCLNKLTNGGRLALETSTRKGPNSGTTIKRYGDTQIELYNK